MFGWFEPKWPVNEEEKAWVEQRTLWLVEQFGRQRLNEIRVVLPTPEFFPDGYDGDEPSVQAILDRVCGYLRVDAARVELAFYSEAGRPHLIDEHGRPTGGTAGLYEEGEKSTIWVEASQLDDPTALVATLAHELSHVLLLGERRIDPETDDMEQVTDLLTVFLGFGIFTANTTVRESYEDGGNWHRWQIGRQGYLTQCVLGYALAFFAWLRGESDPAWAKYLRPDVRSPFRNGLRFLIKEHSQ